jgi:hypothetical protein
MTHTSRFAHLAETKLKVGDTVKRGDVIGVMGNTGSEKTGIHLHIDVVDDEQKQRYNLRMMGEGKPKPNKKQLDYFIDDELFGVKPVITAGYNDPEYAKEFYKPHPAYDVVPFDRHTTREHYKIYWNRSKVGRVVRVDYNDPGYGTVVYIAFDS